MRVLLVDAAGGRLVETARPLSGPVDVSCAVNQPDEVIGQADPGSPTIAVGRARQVS